jgi:hypothetical protein
MAVACTGVTPIGNTLPQGGVTKRLTGEQLSLAVTTQGTTAPFSSWNSTVMGAGQTMVGGVVSTTVTVWLHVAVLVAPSTACHIRVAVKLPPHPALVTVLTTDTTGTLPLSVAVGGSKFHAARHSTTLLLAQVITGGAVSRTVTVKVQVAELVQASMDVACTVVTPIGNKLPAGGVTVRLIGEHVSLAETTKGTTAPVGF